MLFADMTQLSGI